MQKLITLFVTLSMLATFTVAASLERVKRQNLQGLAIPREFQNINFENYLKNPRAVQFQLKCVIYDGPCDSIGKYLKANLPNWLNTQCKNCNSNQKKQAGKAITFFQSNYPKEWNDAVKKYRGVFTEEDVRRFETQLGIKVNLEAPIPAEGVPKPDGAGLAALVRESINAAKSTEEPLIFEARSTAGKALASSTTSKPVEASSSSTTKATTTKTQDDTTTEPTVATTGVTSA